MRMITVQATMQDGTVITDYAHTLSEFHWLLTAYRADPDCIELAYWQEPPDPPAALFPDEHIHYGLRVAS